MLYCDNLNMCQKSRLTMMDMCLKVYGSIVFILCFTADEAKKLIQKIQMTLFILGISKNTIRMEEL